ncbi:UvrD-helicase domain-containing protein [Orrella marina]|uniref:DNA 3'-5' helicase n=1 Tax=Orrella marina TaxID=2163011 RepID=A0A2R4XHP5_9BURK|nr:UvrD-helicase domain-containing protein [Orrella marina]AWB33342.1 DNA helicase II [Orrella marina]
MIEQLNPYQSQAVTHEDGHALILAGAGSGKTRVLTTRIVWLIQQKLISPHAILAVTFTNKAAREMKSRIAAMLPINVGGMWVGTFHGLCNRLLRAHYRDANLPQTFQILDNTDQLAAIKRILKAGNFDESKFPPRDVLRFIASRKEEGLRPDAVQAQDPYSLRMVEIYRLYEAQCQREGVVDFAELLLRCLELLERNPVISQHYQQRFQHILVDEFQDTNRLQYRWLQCLAGPRSFMFAVGDDDQSIYAFRGARVGNMVDFERDYAKGHVIRLEQNYRSYGHILNAANALIANNTERLGKNLWTEQGEGEQIRVMELASDHEEAQWVVDEVRALIRDGMSRSDIAILYRSNAQSRVLEHALFTSGIPYRVYGGLRFFERQEIKHALAYLRLTASLDDDNSFLRVVNFPARGIGARTLENLTDQARTYSTPLAQAVARVAGKAGSSLVQFCGLIQRLTEASRTLPLSELVDEMIEVSGLRAYYQTQRDGSERLENLEELVTAAKVFEIEQSFSGLPAGLTPRQINQNSPDPFEQAPAIGQADGVDEALSPLVAFLAHASLESGDAQADDGTQAVQLMTVHSAKGLEFDAVFLTGLEDGLFPHENSIHERDGLQEERRLMYVAMTRARERLYMTLAQSRMLHGQVRYSRASRFVEEVPPEHLKWLSARAADNVWLDLAPMSTATSGRRSSSGAGFSQGPGATTTMARGVEVGGVQYRAGLQVSHPRFGEGTVLTVSGAGLDAQAQINFADVGVKTLALGIAKLTVLS